MRITNALKLSHFADDYNIFLDNFFGTKYINDHPIKDIIQFRIEHPFIFHNYISLKYVLKWLHKNYNLSILNHTYRQVIGESFAIMKTFHILNQKKAFSARLCWANRLIKYVGSEYEETIFIVKISDLINRYSVKQKYPTLQNYAQTGFDAHANKIMKFNLLIVLEVFIEYVLDKQFEEFSNDKITKKMLRLR